MLILLTRSNLKYKLSLLIILLWMMATIIAIILIKYKYQHTIVPFPKFQRSIPSIPNTQYKIPDTIYWLVPFTPQAPTSNWDELHNEACEEANAIMAAAYFFNVIPNATPPTGGGDPESISGSRITVRDDKINLPADFVEKEIAQLTQWQQENFGYYLDTTSEETARMMEKFYGLKTKLLNNFTANDIKKELAENHLVIISENGRKLNNPYYKRPGPIHHMLIIKGYDTAGNFITNDSGTKRGLNYPYTFDTIYNAAADWNHFTKTVDETQKNAIVVWK